MKQVFCDRCGKELQEEKFAVDIQANRALIAKKTTFQYQKEKPSEPIPTPIASRPTVEITANLDLCMSCAKEVKKILEQLEEVIEENKEV